MSDEYNPPIGEIEWRPSSLGLQYCPALRCDSSAATWKVWFKPPGQEGVAIDRALTKKSAEKRAEYYETHIYSARKIHAERLRA